MDRAPAPARRAAVELAPGQTGSRATARLARAREQVAERGARSVIEATGPSRATPPRLAPAANAARARAGRADGEPDPNHDRAAHATAAAAAAARRGLRQGATEARRPRTQREREAADGARFAGPIGRLPA